MAIHPVLLQVVTLDSFRHVYDQAEVGVLFQDAFRNISIELEVRSDCLSCWFASFAFQDKIYCVYGEHDANADCYELEYLEPEEVTDEYRITTPREMLLEWLERTVVGQGDSKKDAFTDLAMHLFEFGNEDSLKWFASSYQM